MALQTFNSSTGEASVQGQPVIYVLSSRSARKLQSENISNHTNRRVCVPCSLSCFHYPWACLPALILHIDLSPVTVKSATLRTRSKFAAEYSLGPYIWKAPCHSVEQCFSACGLWLLCGLNDLFTGVTHEISCLSVIYIMIHNSSEITKVILWLESPKHE